MPQTASPRVPSSTARAALVAAALPKGGWPYYAGKGGRVEPTAWALLALSGTADLTETRLRAEAIEFLRTLQGASGLLIEPGTSDPNYGWNALALLAMSEDPPSVAPAVAEKVAAALVAVKGVKLPANAAIKQDTSLQAWSWTPGTFSWIEPTAYALLALKKRAATGESMAGAAARIADAEAVLIDRVCGPGGWNYGNSQVLSQDLRPYVPTTALALLALQGRRDHPAAVKSLEWLTSHATAERSAMALSLAAICLSVYKRPIDEVLKALVDEQGRPALSGNVHLAAMAAYALALPVRGARAFTY